jgi:anti-sigma B factor antagonist
LQTFRNDRGNRIFDGMETATMVTTDRETGDCLLRIEGAFDARTVGEVRRAIQAVVARRPRRVTVDLERVPLIDSTAVGAIVSLWKQIRAQGGWVAVVGAHDQPLAVFEVLKLDAFLGMS